MELICRHCGEELTTRERVYWHKIFRGWDHIPEPREINDDQSIRTAEVPASPDKPNIA